MCSSKHYRTHDQFQVLYDHDSKCSFLVHILLRHRLPALINLAYQVLEGLAFLNSHGLVHRSLSAQNVLLDPQVEYSGPPSLVTPLLSNFPLL